MNDIILKCLLFLVCCCWFTQPTN